jgi:8-oxo-dGTP pyrophosphatase MutT (NUDIX family)
MSNEKIIFSTEHIAIKETARGFHYLERLGKDSVAIFLVKKDESDSSKYEVLIRMQPLPQNNSEIDGKQQLYACPFTGRIEPGEAPEQAAIRETLEESGYATQVISLGKYFVGTQTNETCYLYYADVTEIEPQTALQDGTYFESISKNEWHPLEYLSECDYVACQLGYFKLKNKFSLDT